MNSEQRTARIVGVLFILAMASSMLSGVFFESKNALDYLGAVSANENQVFIGILLLLTLTTTVVSIPILMFPIFKKHNESLAHGYIGARIFEGISDFILAISMLLLLILSREVVISGDPGAAYFQTSGAQILAFFDWIGVLENIPYCLGGLIFNYLLYKSKLVPRWLSIWGLIGASLLLTRVPLSMFLFDPLSTILLAIPIVLNEMVLAIWLIVKGFNLSLERSEK